MNIQTNEGGNNSSILCIKVHRNRIIMNEFKLKGGII